MTPGAQGTATAGSVVGGSGLPTAPEEPREDLLTFTMEQLVGDASVDTSAFPERWPQGELSQTVSRDMSIEREDSILVVKRPTDRGEHRALHGLTRSLIANMVSGVTVGFTLLGAYPVDRPGELEASLAEASGSASSNGGGRKKKATPAKKAAPKKAAPRKSASNNFCRRRDCGICSACCARRSKACR